ncbi:MAG: murein biosynthesis integral membrane protein MurJ [Proteobacteria bacterium]|nr:murein biosynthesis integral membrane protein MurJ [Pseudomonadota bacterium]
MSVARSSFIFGIGTFLSRISGVVRESVAGAVFGASIYMDAFIVAFRIPNLLRDLLAEGALGSSFTKVYSSICAGRKDSENGLNGGIDSGSANGSDRGANSADAKQVLIQTLQLVTLISIVVCGLGILFAKPLVLLMMSSSAEGKPSDLLPIATGLTQILFPFIGFASLGAVIQGVLYQRGGFFLAGVAPIVFNVMSILGALWFGDLAVLILPESMIHYFGNAPILGFALGTLLGGAAQAAVQLLGIWRPLLSLRDLLPTAFPWSRDVKKIFILMTPMVIAASSGQINMMVNTNFATSLGAGAVTWLNFAFRLLQLPIGMFGVAVGAAVLPALTKSITAAGGRVDAKASKEALNAMDLVVWLMIPCMMFMHGSASDITRVLFQAGRFSPADTAATAIAIQGYSLGLAGYGLIKVLNSYYYAIERTRFPMYVSLFSIAANYLANAFLVHKYGHQGLALTASFILTLNAAILMVGTARDCWEINRKQVLESIGYLALGMLAVYGLRLLYQNAVEGFSLSEFFGFETKNTLILKVDSAFRLCIDGGAVVVVFGGIGLARLKRSPKNAIKMLRRRRS